MLEDFEKTRENYLIFFESLPCYDSTFNGQEAETANAFSPNPWPARERTTNH